MKCLTFVCLLLAVGRGRARPEAPSSNATDAAEDQGEVQGRVLYNGSQLWKTFDITKEKISVLAELRDEKGKRPISNSELDTVK